MMLSQMRVGKLISALFLLVSLSSCFKDPNFEKDTYDGGPSSVVTPERIPTEEERNVMIMVSAGYNSLSGYLREDLEDLAQGYLPDGTYRVANALVVLSRLPVSSGDYNTPSAPVLYRMYSDRKGGVIRDTLKVWAGDTPLCSKETLSEALSLVYRRIPAKSYGMVFSSHASGWTPVGYYNDPSAYEKGWSGGGLFSARRRRAWNPSEATFPAIDPVPAVKSIGQDKVGATGFVEMTVEDFADAIPFHMDYVLIDACLSGCVEVAHALREKADIVGFSQTEVLADGFDYKTITNRLLQGTPDPVAVCKDYFEYYDAQSGSNRSATISVVDTRKMDALTQLCATLFEKYRSALSTLSGSKVQGYFRYERHFFYDLRDILVNAGISAEEEAALDAALQECVVYKAATPQFLSIPLNHVCGLSMYLPSMGSDFLDKFYREHVSWNTATNLVK